jgi:hypothetical protein
LIKTHNTSLLKTIFAFDRGVKAVRLISAGIPLAVPLSAARLIAGSVKPQGSGRRNKTLSVDNPPGQADFRLPGRLIEVSVKGGFEPAGALEDHPRDRRDIDKIQASRPDSVNPDVPYQKHAHNALALGLGSHQAGEQLDFFFRVPYYCH